ncbi:MAG: ABC transporter substrate-binding protein [Bacillota bacterium]|nr:ABC transporter substrate-binding protein [Bacillota bacterium]
MIFIPSIAGPPRRAFCCILILLVVLTGGCFSPPPESDGSTTDPEAREASGTAQEYAVPTFPEEAPVSGELRMLLPEPDSYYPLEVRDRRYRQILPLLHDSLFTWTANGALTFGMVETAAWTDSQTSLVLSLRPGQRWQDSDDEITAADVVATLEAILRQPASPWYAGLDRVRRIASLDQYRVEISLSRPDPYLVYALTFPVLKAGWLAGDRSSFPPSSGPYRATGLSREEGLVLERNPAYPGSADYLVPRIRIRFYRDIADASRAMLDDEADLLALDQEGYARMHRSGALSISRFPCERYFYVHYQAGEGRALANADLFRAVKAELTDLSSGRTSRAGRAQTAWEPQPLLATFALPFVPTFASVWPAATQLFAGSSLKDAAGWTPDPEAAPLRLIFRHGDFDETLAEALARRLETVGIRIEVAGLGAETYDNAIADQAYDLCLASCELGHIPDPLWLYAPGSGHGPEPGYEWSQAAPSDWTESLAALRRYRLPAGVLEPFADPAWRELVAACEAEGPFSSIGFLYEGVILGDRLQGPQPRNCYRPYALIEENWTWSGSSLSPE